MHILKNMCEIRGNLSSIYHNLQRALAYSKDSPSTYEHIALASKEVAISIDEAQKYIHEQEQRVAKQFKTENK